MLKSAMSGKISRGTIKGSESGRFAQSFDVGLCARCCGGDTCPWRLGSAIGSFGRWKLQQSGASASVLHLKRVSSFGSGEGMSVLVLVILRLDMLG
ncbi:unnamed protein product [Prunus armeniaca]